MKSVEMRLASAKEYVRSGLTFFHALASNVKSGSEANRRLSSKLEHELEKRTRTDTYEVSETDWNMYKKKLFRFRPRLLGGAAAYATIAQLSHKKVQENGGFALFRMLWFLGSSQDDLIDELERDATPLDIRKKQIRAAIFGKDRIFYQAAFSVFAQELMSSDIGNAQQRYIKTKVSEWYRFLVQQEAEVLSEKDFSDLTFDYCISYREAQNQKIGEVLTACLNGKQCLEPEKMALESIVPLLSFRTQIIDDIADIAEDLKMGRPSYCVGALIDNPDELYAMKEYLKKHPTGKITPMLFQRIAPKSYAIVRAKFEEYGTALREQGASGVFLSSIGNMLFTIFPKWRDAIYKIHPDSANF